MVNLEEKKFWLNWLLQNIQFQRREVSWILAYLMNHEAILRNVQIVEHAHTTPRGIVIFPEKEAGNPITLYLQGHEFIDADQIFHEIRFNWKQPLYLECALPDAWEQAAYLAVLEDNPYHRWNDSLSEGVIDDIAAFITHQEQQEKKQQLLKKIDECLDQADQSGFLAYSQILAELEEQKQ